MSRNLEEASARLFGRLIETARLSGHDCVAGPRWFRGTGDDRARAASLKLKHKVQFSRHRALVHLEAENEHLVGLVGFESDEFVLPGTTETDVEDPVAFLLLAETDVAPIKTPADIFNVVGERETSSESYDGYAPELIKALFPSLRVLSIDGGLDSLTIWPMFLRLSAYECASGNSWMTTEMSAALVELADAQMDRFPYEALCRSVFDIDPRSLFLAIYRCLEALQAYDACSRLRIALDINAPWYVLAETLGQELGWYPKQSALSGVLSHLDGAYLEPLCDALSWEKGERLEESASNALTSIRNRIVHFTTPDKAVGVDSYDWNVVCAAFARLVGAVHQTAFSAQASEAVSEIRDAPG